MKTFAALAVTVALSASPAAAQFGGYTTMGPGGTTFINPNGAGGYTAMGPSGTTFINRH